MHATPVVPIYRPPESPLAGKLLQRARMDGCLSSSPKLCPCERGLLVDRKKLYLFMVYII